MPGVCDMEVYFSFLHGKSSLLLKLHRKRYNITNFDLITIQLLIRKYVFRKYNYNESMNLLKYQFLSSMIVLVSYQNNLNAGSIFVPRVIIVFVSDQNNLKARCT